MKIVLLIDDSRGLTTEEKVREAFDTSPKVNISITKIWSYLIRMQEVA